MSIRIGICDDEKLQVKINGSYIKEIATRNSLDISLVGFTSIDQLFIYLSKNELDILFLDIDMGEKSGIQAAAKLYNAKPELIIVFITGHREFACEAFDVDALGYILKPVDTTKLERTLKKAIHQISSSTHYPNEAFLIVNQENGKKKLYINDILYIERVKARSIITTKTETYAIYESITSLSEKLTTNFIRINQSEVINLSEIADIKGNTLLTKEGVEKSISRSYKKDVLKAYFNI